MRLGIYIHIPFCEKKCLYCDFPSYAKLNYLHDEYLNALRREIAGQGVRFSAAMVDTIYIGGGTPTILSAGQITELISWLEQHFTVAEQAEISIEANPGTVDLAKLAAIRAAGINRLSFGIQSFTDKILTGIGRIHTAEQAIAAVEAARSAGFTNINIDLMYGLPGQTLSDLKNSLTTAVSLKVPHLSIYGLKVEEGTTFGEWQKQGRLQLPPEELEEAMYDFTVKFLPDSGLARYEISNYARPGYECQHNLKYWRYKPYLGLGAAAHSFVGGERFCNTSNIIDYITALTDGHLPVIEREKAEQAAAMAEYTFLALRLSAGLKFTDFFAYFKVDLRQIYGTILEQLVKQQLIICDAEGIRLTPRGMKFGNLVFAAFLV